MYDYLTFTIDQGVGTISLNRTKSLNALNNDVIAELMDAFETCQYGEKIRVIVLEGKGRGFCAGDDLKGMGTEKHPNPEDKLKEFQEGYPRLVLKMQSIEKPIICKVHGFALGAGFELALCADILISTKDAKFGLPFVLRGIAAGTHLLQQYVGYHKACEMLFTGETITGEEAKKLGIVNRLSIEKELDDDVNQLASQLANGATRAIGLMKSALNRSANYTLEEGMHEQAYATTASFMTQDFVEGHEAFKEKREPVFKGK
ncbi:enoyl-CoA hydratase/isomerase family protein [Evansella halocellulosilytica]|uniref:enoyl-CoA hydratase/isomerase family protein n=1 Tax=Evansella halocellulosilytica TaxID=2011013 RepID=UPI000BB7284F|nr:enoyl-CoA hydratase-related protein [Evansella halocellulosilytica]